MSIDQNQLESIRDKAFKIGQSESDMFQAKKFFKLSYAIEDYLRCVQNRQRPLSVLPSHLKFEKGQKT